MEVLLPPVFSIQESTPTNNLIRQIGVPAARREGQLANYTGDRVRGHILVSDGLPELLIVPARTKNAPGDHQHVIAADIDPTAQTQDLTDATWLRHPRLRARNATPRDQVIAQVATSWVAPSGIRANSRTLIATGMAPVSEPVALTAAGIEETLDDYRRAAANAKEAGFDGVEIHAANGYLIDQFLRTGTNQRTDEYGGAASNRVRFLTEAVELVLEAWDSGQVGVRISPTGSFNDMSDDNPFDTFSVAVGRLNDYGLGYLHVVEMAQNSKGPSEVDIAMSAQLRTLWKGLYVANGGYDGPRGEEAIRSGHADAIAYGRPFLANPDLPRRLQLGAALNEPDPTTFYGGCAAGYTSYPALS
jgi:2,4-dienoyl-CoA reductase-like NADH-dependent reductase (Old Yellow Enzyme family)